MNFLEKKYIFLFFLSFYCQDAANHVFENPGTIYHNHLHFTLIGANGDLARKYLWKGIFGLYRKYSHNNEWNFTLYGAGTSPVSKGEKNLDELLNKVITCPETDQQCVKDRLMFLNKVVYVQLKVKEDYADYCKNVEELAKQGYCQPGHSCEYQHIFYLSVPPFAYENIAENISFHCRPAEGSGSLKVVFEKPFGHNRLSANALAVAISKYLNETEVYRVDHYLGKQTVQQIIPFRQENGQVEKMLNSRNVERIEVVMKETVGVRGRTKFYNKYGVICDVMQNHLSEILYLLTMKLPMKSTNYSLTDVITINKLKLLQQIKPLSKKDAVFGQYEDYQEEVRFESSNNSVVTLVPTFAGVKLKIKSFRWRNTPILMVAGKMLGEHTSYARIVFKETMFQVNSNHDCPLLQEIIFHIGNGHIGSPAILVSRGLPIEIDYIPGGWLETKAFDESSYFQSKLKCYHVFVPKVLVDPYAFLIEQTFLGHQENFLTTKALLDSWSIWAALINYQNTNKHMQLYPGGQNADLVLDFKYNINELTFGNVQENANGYRLVTRQNWLGNHTMVTGEETGVIATLAEEIRTAAVNTVKNGKDFHIAFSGGTSPLKLFEHISMVLEDDIPWENVHIWQVDERCTADLSQSNFEALSRTLIDNIPFLKYKNIHAMPVSTLFPSQCNNESAKFYENQLKLEFQDEVKLDYIVLGMGYDGHTASLFPYHAALAEKNSLIVIANEVPVERTRKRMTMTYKILNSAKKIGILVGGEHKCDMLNILKNSQCDDAISYIEYPICGISTSNNHVAWYIIHAECEEQYYL